MKYKAPEKNTSDEFFRIKPSDSEKLLKIADYYGISKAGWLKQAIAADWPEVEKAIKKGSKR